MEFDIQKAIQKIENLPTFSQAGRRALAMLSETNVSKDDLAVVIKSDQALTAKILSAVNSPVFGLYREIKNLNEALRFLGLNETRKMVFVATTHFLFGGTQDYKTWQHAILCAAIAETLSEICAERINKNNAYLAGLLHDGGKTFIEKIVPVVYRQVLPSLTKEMGRLNAELSLFGMDHTEIGGMMLEYWNFNDQFVNSVAYHHSPVFAFSDPLGHLIWITNQTAHIEDQAASDDAKITSRTIEFVGFNTFNQLVNIKDQAQKEVDAFLKKLEALL